MVEKVRVLFNIPQVHPKWSKVAHPVEIPLVKYMEFRLKEREGDRYDMTEYVTKNFLGGFSVSSEQIEMVTAVGNSMIILDIDSQIEQGINPLQRTQEEEEEDEDEENEEGKNVIVPKKQAFIALCLVISIMLLSLYWDFHYNQINNQFL